MSIDMTRKGVRRWLIGSYFALFVAGVTIPAGLDLVVTHLEWLWWVMSVWLAGGAAMAVVSQARGRWTGEFVGLPLVGSSLFVFALLQIQVSGWNIYVVPSVSLLWAFVLILAARWRDVHDLYRGAKDEAPPCRP